MDNNINYIGKYFILKLKEKASEPDYIVAKCVKDDKHATIFVDEHRKYYASTEVVYRLINID